MRSYLSKIAIVSILAQNILLFRDITFLLGIAINVLSLIAYKYEDGESTANDFESTINMLGIIVIVLVLMIASYFLAKTVPLLVKKAWLGVSKDKLNIFAWLWRLLKTIYYLLTDFSVLYYLVYSATAILGTFLNHFFYAFHLYDIIMRYPDLRNVIMSVWT